MEHETNMQAFPRHPSDSGETVLISQQRPQPFRPIFGHPYSVVIPALMEGDALRGHGWKQTRLLHAALSFSPIDTFLARQS